MTLNLRDDIHVSHVSIIALLAALVLASPSGWRPFLNPIPGKQSEGAVRQMKPIPDSGADG